MGALCPASNLLERKSESVSNARAKTENSAELSQKSIFLRMDFLRHKKKPISCGGEKFSCIIQKVGVEAGSPSLSMHNYVSRNQHWDNDARNSTFRWSKFLRTDNNTRQSHFLESTRYSTSLPYRCCVMNRFSVRIFRTTFHFSIVTVVKNKVKVLLFQIPFSFLQVNNLKFQENLSELWVRVIFIFHFPFCFIFQFFLACFVVLGRRFSFQADPTGG